MRLNNGGRGAAPVEAVRTERHAAQGGFKTMNAQTKRALRYLASHQHTLQKILLDGNGDDLERTL